MWIGGGVLALATMGSVAPYLFGDEPDVAAPAPQAAPPQPGREQTIDMEVERARRVAPVAPPQEIAEPQVAANTAVVVPPPTNPVVPPINPVPPEARRSDSSAAVYATQKTQTRQMGDDAEVEAAARTSKSIAFDGSDMQVASKSSVDDRLSSLIPSTPGSPNPSLASPQASGQARPTALDALLKAQGKTQGGGVISPDREWLKEFAAQSGDGSSKVIRGYRVTSPYTVLQGKVLPAVLMRDINTDLPGEVSACVTLDVYDSLTSDHLLIPKGSCLVGQYSSSLRPGQSRIMFAFNRIILPNGYSFDLQAATGSDEGGSAGLKGDVNNHFFRIFSTSFLIAWMSQRLEKGDSGGTSIGAPSGAKSAAGQVLVDTSRMILERDKMIQPTATIPKGERINIDVTRDMEFPGPYRK